MCALILGQDKTGKTKREEEEEYPPSNSFIHLLTSHRILTRNCDLLSQSTTEKLIELLKEHAGLKDCNEETVKHINSILLEIYGRVRKNEKPFKRGFILGGLYGLVECTSAKILLAVAKVVLALRVTGSNLTGACKLIFKVARNEQNDHLFLDNDTLELLVDGLGRASPLDDPEACIYGYGSIRFLTSSSGQERAEASSTNLRDVNRNWSERLQLPKKPATAPVSGSTHQYIIEMEQKEKLQKLSKQNSLVERLARHGAVELMVLHLQMLNEAGATRKLTGPPLHSLYQLSAALRALADVRQSTSSIGLSQSPGMEPQQMQVCDIQLELACPHLIRAAEISIGELEVQANIVRTLSVLSEDDECCGVLANFTPRIGILLGPCCEYFSSSSEKLLSLFSRLGYILGNIMANFDGARVQFYHNDAAMEYLLRVLELYSQVPLKLYNSLGDSVADVLIKMTRVVANMSVNSEVGFGLGNTRALGATLLHLLKLSAEQMKTNEMTTEMEELLNAILSALHNLCFYQDNNTTPAQVIEAKGSLQSILPELTNALCMTLRTCEDDTIQLETVRVLGNLTRSEKARAHFCAVEGLPLVLELLHRSSRPRHEFKSCAIGVLVNLLGDWQNRTPFLQLQGAEILAELLKEAVHQTDWFMGVLACQAFWNLLIDTPHANEVCQESILDDVCDMLVDVLDEERMLSDNTATEDFWDDFGIVAADLLHRIQRNYNRPDEERTDSVASLSDNQNDEEDVFIDEM